MEPIICEHKVSNTIVFLEKKINKTLSIEKKVLVLMKSFLKVSENRRKIFVNF